MKYRATFKVVNQTEVSFVIKKDFNSKNEANAWFNANIDFDDTLFSWVTFKEIPPVLFKVAYNKIEPSFIMLEAQDENEAKIKAEKAFEYIGYSGWDILSITKAK